jgi:hypothetical protein
VGTLVLTASAGGGSEKLARVVSVADVDSDSDESSDDESGGGDDGGASSGGPLLKKLYELLFVDDGATLSKVASLSHSLTCRASFMCLQLAVRVPSKLM